MKSSVPPESITTIMRCSPVTFSVAYDSALYLTRPDSTYKSGKVVQTSGATSGCHLAFVGGGRQITQFRMQAYIVVKADDVVGDISYGFTTIGVVTLPNALHLEIQEESFHDGVDAPMSS